MEFVAETHFHPFHPSIESFESHLDAFALVKDTIHHHHHHLTIIIIITITTIIIINSLTIIRHTFHTQQHSFQVKYHLDTSLE